MTIRLHTASDLRSGARVALPPAQAHYLLQVMRLKAGAELALFNGREGEWRAVLAEAGKKSAVLEVREQRRPQVEEPDVWLLFAPLKHARINYLVEKAAELGASRLIPVLTERTVARRINLERLQANAVEAAEQSERLTVPEVAELEPLPRALAAFPVDRRLVFCDESGSGEPMAGLLSRSREGAGGGKFAPLIGPEGGFAAEESRMIRSLPQALPVSLGPRVLRADTAALAALAVLQSLTGGWEGRPAFRGP